MQEYVVLSLHVRHTQIVSILEQGAAHKVLRKDFIGICVCFASGTYGCNCARLRQEHNSFGHRPRIAFIKTANRTGVRIQHSITILVRKLRKVRKFQQTFGCPSHLGSMPIEYGHQGALVQNAQEVICSFLLLTCGIGFVIQKVNLFHVHSKAKSFGGRINHGRQVFLVNGMIHRVIRYAVLVVISSEQQRRSPFAMVEPLDFVVISSLLVIVLEILNRRNRQAPHSNIDIIRLATTNNFSRIENTKEVLGHRRFLLERRHIVRAMLGSAVIVMAGPGKQDKA